MPNLKFSQFSAQTDPANVQFLVGYNGTANVRIAPGDLGGGGASSLNGLSDVLIDTASEYVGTVPAGLSGNPQGNTTLGIDAGNAITNGAQNTVIGNDAMKFQTARSEYAVVGYQAGFNCTGNSVTALGWQAAYAGNQDGSVSIGTSAHGTGFAANDAVAVGSLAAYTGTATGSVAIGKRAGYNGNDKTNSVLIGFDAGRSASSTGHISIGYQAGYTNTSGSENTNIGYEAGYSNSTNGSRTTVGYQAGKFHTGSLSTFLGYQAGLGVSSSSVGTQNTGVGRTALTALTSGAYNTALGSAAGNAITSGTSNVVIGRSSAGSLNTGSNNIVIGHNANVSSGSVDNEITLGDANITTLRCQVQTISALSDSRDKTNVQPSPYGLDLISQLQPVTFDWNMRDGAKVGQKDLGFIAQKLQEVDDENLQLVYDNNPDRLEASYGRLIPVLVQAIKELKAEVELLKNK